MNKKREARPRIGKKTKSKNKMGITDLTRNATGLDINDIGFEAKKTEISRIINGMKSVSDIPRICISLCN